MNTSERLSETDVKALMDARKAGEFGPSWGFERVPVEDLRGFLGGWHAVPSWGRDGWDLGEWPLVVISHRDDGGAPQIMYNVEGDKTVYTCQSEAERTAITDYLAWWHWNAACEPWAAGHTFDTAPPELFGPFSWERLDASESEVAD